MKKILLILLSCIMINNVYNQNIKIYKGDYKKGTAEYQYYENSNLERIYHGFFRYNFERYNGITNYSTDKYKITGYYNNNMKDGLWTTIITNKYTKVILTGKYINGYLNGKWSYELKSLEDNKIVKKSTIYYKNNIKINHYSYYQNYDGNPEIISVNYDLDSLGLIHGDFKVTFTTLHNNKYENIRKYSHGELTYKLFRELTTGDIIHLYYSDCISYDYTLLELDDSSIDRDLELDWWYNNYLKKQWADFDYPLYIVPKGINETNLKSAFCK